MDVFLNVLGPLLVMELWLLWWMQFYESSFLKTVAYLEFWCVAFYYWIYFFCKDENSTITQTNEDGEIIRRVFIGR